MTASDVVNPPPSVPVLPTGLMVAVAVLLTILLIVVSARFDKTGGVLTISLLIVVAFIGAVGYCLLFTVPIDEVTPSVVGGLTAGFGAVCAHWLGKINGASSNGAAAHPSPNEPPAS
jgi:hypothetical protein